MSLLAAGGFECKVQPLLCVRCNKSSPHTGPFVVIYTQELLGRGD